MAGETARLAATSLGRNEPALKYLLDSNIVSEPARVRPNGGVLSRLLRYRYEVCIAAPVLHELRYGVSRMPEGVRKRSLAAYLATLLDSTLAVLPYDRRPRSGTPRNGLASTRWVVSPLSWTDK